MDHKTPSTGSSDNFPWSDYIRTPGEDSTEAEPMTEENFIIFNAEEQRLLMGIINFPHPVHAFSSSDGNLKLEWIKQKIAKIGIHYKPYDLLRRIGGIMVDKDVEDDSHLRRSANAFGELFLALHRKQESFSLPFQRFYVPGKPTCPEEHSLALLEMIFKDVAWQSATTSPEPDSGSLRVKRKSELLCPALKEHFDGEMLKATSHLRYLDAETLNLSQEFYDWYFRGEKYYSFVTGQEEDGPDRREFDLEYQAACALGPAARFREFNSSDEKGSRAWTFQERIQYPPLKSFDKDGRLDYDVYKSWLEELNSGERDALDISNTPEALIPDAAILGWKHLSHKQRYYLSQKLLYPIQWGDPPSIQSSIYLAVPPSIQDFFDKEKPFYHPGQVQHMFNLIFLDKSPKVNTRRTLETRAYKRLLLGDDYSKRNQKNNLLHETAILPVSGGFRLGSGASLLRWIIPYQLGRMAQSFWEHLFADNKLDGSNFQWEAYRKDAERHLKDLLEKTKWTPRT